MNTVSLPRALSKLGYTSRRSAEQLVEAGRVKVNGTIIKDTSYRLIPEAARIEVDGKIIRKAEKIYIAFHEPIGVVTTIFTSVP